MGSYRLNLPQLGEEIFLTDSGMETDLVFNKGFDLPCFASFMLLNDPSGRAAMYDYCLEHALLAKRNGFGFIFESATWRASPDWGDRLGLDKTRSKRRTAMRSLWLKKFATKRRLRRHL